MEGIEHRVLFVNGINMHVAEKGEGPNTILFVHGFPELWYSWRYQIQALSAAGYRCIAPDLRGFGDSDVPSDIASYSIFHLVGDLVALIDALGHEQVFLVGHDWGAIVAWHLCLFRPDLVKALVNLSIPYRLWDPFGNSRAVDFLRKNFGDDYYVCRFQEPGSAEADFAAVGTSIFLKSLLTNRNPAPYLIPKGVFAKAIIAAPPVELPSWLSEEDIQYFATKFNQTGFSGGMSYYRNLDSNWEQMAPWTGAQVKVPTKFIVGNMDLAYYIPDVKSYIHDGAFKRDVPLLQDVVIMEDVAHFCNQEKADEINAHIKDFFGTF